QEGEQATPLYAPRCREAGPIQERGHDIHGVGEVIE
ncbi:MAG: hypothetical protein AVDCRST_MAG88-3977, partial [uncultured Thermomicrobiales bacterium]